MTAHPDRRGEPLKKMLRRPSGTEPLGPRCRPTIAPHRREP